MLTQMTGAEEEWAPQSMSTTVTEIKVLRITENALAADRQW